MPVSSEIYGNVGRGVQQLEDPQNALLKALQVQQARMQGQQAQQGVEDDQALRQATMESGGDQNKLMQLLYGKGNYGAASKVQESIQKTAKAKGDLAHVSAQTEREGATARETKRKTEDASLARYRAQLDYIENPQAAARWIQSQYADPDVNPILSQFGPLEQAIAEIPQDPQAFAQWREQQSMGMEKFRAGREQKPTSVDAGGQKLFVDMNPRSPTYKGQISSTAVTQSEPQRLQLEQQAREAAANRGVQIRGQNLTDARSRESTAATMSKPFEVTGPDGNLVLVQQDKQGNITPVTGYGPKVGTNKPLPPGVVKNITEARDNAATIDRLNSSFKDDFASKGVLGMGSDLALSAKSVLGSDGDAVDWWKNYRKQAELVERHALFGAALTPTEQASWRSSDIGPGMDSKVIKRNLATRAKLTKQISEMAAQDQIDAGHSPDRIKAIAGRVPVDQPKVEKTVTRTGTLNGKKVIQYSDGTTEYAN